MKKILVIHNNYRLRGGEDIAVEKEVEFLEQFYDVEVLNYENNISNILYQLFYFLISKDQNSVKKLKKKLDIFKPDIVYVHNTWFKASLGIFDLLKELDIKTMIKLHNFRYNCTYSFTLKHHLKGRDFCEACGIESKKFRFFNKYFENSYLKSFFVILFGKKYFKILKYQNLNILVLTHFHKKYLENLDIDESRIAVFQNYIKPPTRYKDKSNEKYLIYAGRISKEKGVEELITTFLKSSLTNIHLKIVGDGPQLNNLMKKYTSKRIRFLGQKNNEEVYQLISGAESVITATKLFEGQPMLLCEASLIGIPSIYPQSGGIKEFFPENSLYSFEQFNYKDLQDKIELVKNNTISTKEAIRNKEFILKYLDKELLLKRFERIIND